MYKDSFCNMLQLILAMHKILYSQIYYTFTFMALAFVIYLKSPSLLKVYE